MRFSGNSVVGRSQMRNSRTLFKGMIYGVVVLAGLLLWNLVFYGGSWFR